MNLRSPILSALAITLASCAVQAVDSSNGSATPTPSAEAVTVTKAAPGAPTTPAPLPKFDNAERAFAKARADLLESYYRDGVSEEDLYRAALQGMLEHMDPTVKGYNKLLTPAELHDVQSDLEGQVVGIGVEIHFDEASGYTDVLGVFPGSASERAGMLAGDKIVTVDGFLFKGKTVGDVIAHIRGGAGSDVALSVLRGDKLLPFTITRELVVLEPVDHVMLPGRVGYVHVRSFSAKTTDGARAALTDLAQKGAQSLVLDLRSNMGGSFDEAVSTAGLFLPKGSTVVVTKKRGGKDEPSVTKGEPILGGLPLAVLVNGKTSSGAELLAGALQEGRKAELVGARTFGKWTVQVLDELGNGYAMKFTVGVFQTASGRSFDGEGLPPDVEVDMDEAACAKASALSDPAQRLAADGQLRTAIGLLRAR